MITRLEVGVSSIASFRARFQFLTQLSKLYSMKEENDVDQVVVWVKKWIMQSLRCCKLNLVDDFEAAMSACNLYGDEFVIVQVESCN